MITENKNEIDSLTLKAIPFIIMDKEEREMVLNAKTLIAARIQGASGHPSEGTRRLIARAVRNGMEIKIAAQTFNVSPASIYNYLKE